MSPHAPSPLLTTTINDLPFDCLRCLLDRLPLAALLDVAYVSTLWRSAAKSLCLSKRSLLLAIGDVDLAHWRHSPLEDVLDEHGRPMAVNQFKRDFPSGGLKIGKLNDALITLLVEVFPNVIELSVLATNSAEILQLLAHFATQLQTLRVTLRSTEQPDANFFTVINSLHSLKHLELDLSICQETFEPFRLPILRQLDHFDFAAERVEPWFLDYWLPILSRRTTPLRFGFKIYTILRNMELLDISPEVAAMFTHYPTFSVRSELTILRDFAAHFTSLRQLNVAASDVPVPGLLQNLAKLKSLICLGLSYTYEHPYPYGDHMFPQLPNIKRLTLSNRSLCHKYITRWNIGWVFPHLQVLCVDFSYGGCEDCRTKDIEKQRRRVESCCEKQWRALLKKANSKTLRMARFRYLRGGFRLTCTPLGKVEMDDDKFPINAVGLIKRFY